MASSTVLSRLSGRSTSLGLKLASRSAKPSVSPLKPSSQSQISASIKRSSRLPRLPVQMSSLMSMMPLHSAIASARLKSVLSIESQSWGLIPQVSKKEKCWIPGGTGLTRIMTRSIRPMYLHAFMTDSSSIRIINKFPPLANGSSLLLFMKDANPFFVENFIPRGLNW